MIKKILTLAMAIMLIVSTSVFAIDLQAGIETELVLDKGINLKNSGVKAAYSAQYYNATLDINLGDWLTVTPKGGINHFAFRDIDTMIGEIELNGGIGWNLGIDAKADVYTLMLNEDTTIVDFSLIGSYRFSRTDIDEVDLAGLVIDNPIESIAYIHEWEVGAIVSRNLKDITGISITPYMGMVYSDMVGKIDTNLSIINLDEDIEARRNFGLRCGLSAEPIDDLLIAVDAKFVDETAVIISASYKF